MTHSQVSLLVSDHKYFAFKHVLKDHIRFVKIIWESLILPVSCFSNS